jgi:hypothetical protein
MYIFYMCRLLILQWQYICVHGISNHKMDWLMLEDDALRALGNVRSHWAKDTESRPEHGSPRPAARGHICKLLIVNKNQRDTTG